MNKQHLMEHFLKQYKINPSVASSLLKDFDSNGDNSNGKYILWKGDTEGRAFIDGKITIPSIGGSIPMQWYKVKEEPFINPEEIKYNLLILTANDVPVDFSIYNPDENSPYKTLMDDKDNWVVLHEDGIPVLSNINTPGDLLLGTDIFEVKEKGVYFVKMAGESETIKLSFLGK
jgi:hypothetical protein